MLYRIIKISLQFYFPLFFKKLTIKGLSHVPKNQAVIFAVNHQNTFIDATLVAFRLKKSVYMLVRSDVFKGTIVNVILKTLHLIPIYRKQDNNGNLKNKNQQTIDLCTQYLQQKKQILIFPEGVSNASHGLQALKKGMARLAFNAEKSNNFKLDLMIIPVTINYENHFLPQKEVLIQFCEPILVKNYEKEYQNNPQKTINQLTTDIETVLKDNLLQQTFKQYQSTKNVNYYLGKIVFFPTLFFTRLLYQKVNDKDFFLSIIGFSWLVLGGLQITTISLLVFVFHSMIMGFISLFTLLLIGKNLLAFGDILVREKFKNISNTNNC